MIASDGPEAIRDQQHQAGLSEYCWPPGGGSSEMRQRGRRQPAPEQVFSYPI